MPAVGDVYQFTFIQQLQLQILETVIHFRSILPAQPTEAQVRATADNWLSTMKLIQTVFCTYPQVRVKQMTPLAFDQMMFAPTVLAGTINEQPQNNQISIIFTKRTGVAGLRHRGRMYVAGFPLVWGLNTLLPGTPTVSMNTVAIELLSKFGEGGTDPTFVAGVYSKEIGGTLPFTVAGWQPITRWDPQITFGVQRKRRIGVGI